MDSKKKKIGNAVFLLVVFGLTMFLVFRGQDLGAILATASGALKRYIVIGIVCVVTFILGESCILFYMFRTLGARVNPLHCALYSFVGFFYSCITPSASGGQPMQIYYMKKDKLPIPVTTLVLMIVTITYKAVLVLIGILVMIFGRDLLHTYMGNLLWVFYIGLLLNVFAVSSMLVLVFAPGLAKKIMVKGLSILEKLHLVKKKESRLKKLEDSMDQYHETAAFWAGHKKVIANVFVITFIQRAVLFTVTWWIYKALGLSGYSFFTITLLQSVISVSVDMLPLPGGMGISETLYLTMFGPVFNDLLLASMLLSRGISYYGQMLISAVMSGVAHLVIRGDEDYGAGLHLKSLRRKTEKGKTE